MILNFILTLLRRLISSRSDWRSGTCLVPWARCLGAVTTSSLPPTTGLVAAVDRSAFAGCTCNLQTPRLCGKKMLRHFHPPPSYPHLNPITHTPIFSHTRIRSLTHTNLAHIHPHPHPLSSTFYNPPTSTNPHPLTHPPHSFIHLSHPQLAWIPFSLPTLNPLLASASPSYHNPPLPMPLTHLVYCAQRAWTSAETPWLDRHLSVPDTW